MKKLIRIIIKTVLILFVLFFVMMTKLIAEAIFQTSLGAIEIFILYAGGFAAISAIYKYEGKSSSSATEVSLNKAE